jgi:hypothetical protein
MDAREMEKFDKVVTVELLSTIDHKVRGIQQFVVALRGLVEDEVLNDLREETEELQAIYESFLELRDLHLEKFDIGKFLREEYNVENDVACLVESDKKKLSFVLDTLMEFCGDLGCRLSISSTQKGCVINICSPAFAQLCIDDFKKLSRKIDGLPFFAINKIIKRMGGDFSVDGEDISIEFFNTDYDDA